MPDIRWENNILGFVPKTDWLDVPFQIQRPNDPADMVFGDLKTDNLVAEWESIASEYQIPMMAQFHGFDTESQTTFRYPIDTHNIEKGLIKVKINQSERMRALLRSGVQGDTALYDYVINDGARLAEQVITRTKVAKNELLATGKVTIKENNLNLTVDYGVPAAHTTLSLDLGGNVPEQIQEIVDTALAEGTIITGIYTSRKVVGQLRRDENIQKAINGNMGIGALVSRTALENYLAEEFGITQLITNDLTYGVPDGFQNDRPKVVTKRYYPDNKITFFSTNVGGQLGMGLWGDAPELDVQRLLDVASSEESPYVAITQWSEKDPAVLWTKASALFMPVLYNPNSLFIAEVEADDSFLTDLTVATETDSFGVLYDGKKASDLQTGVTVADGKVRGTLKFIEGGLDPSGTGPLSGDGYFLALKWSNLDTHTNSLKVGLDPSEGTGMVECFDDSDRNGVFKITDKDSQRLKIVQSDGTHKNIQAFALDELVLEPAGA